MRLCESFSSSFWWIEHILEVLSLGRGLLLNRDKFLVVKSSLSYHLVLRVLWVDIRHNIQSFSFFELVHCTSSYKSTFLMTILVGIHHGIRSLWRDRFSSGFSDIDGTFVTIDSIIRWIFLRGPIRFAFRSLCCSLMTVTHVELILASRLFPLLLIIFRAYRVIDKIYCLICFYSMHD